MVMTSILSVRLLGEIAAIADVTDSQTLVLQFMYCSPTLYNYYIVFAWLYNTFYNNTGLEYPLLTILVTKSEKYILS